MNGVCFCGICGLLISYRRSSDKFNSVPLEFMRGSWVWGMGYRNRSMGEDDIRVVIVGVGSKIPIATAEGGII